METASERALHVSSSDKQARLWKGYRRESDSNASSTVPFRRRKLTRADEKVRKAQIVNQRRAEHAGKTEYALVGPAKLASPVRRIRIGLVGRRSEASAAVMRVAQEGGLCAGDTTIEAQAGLVSEYRAWSDATQVSKIRR
jgi:hypothetical protein